jgi:hypothetical protein
VVRIRGNARLDEIFFALMRTRTHGYQQRRDAGFYRVVGQDFAYFLRAERKRDRNYSE